MFDSHSHDVQASPADPERNFLTKIKEPFVRIFQTSIFESCRYIENNFS